MEGPRERKIGGKTAEEWRDLGYHEKDPEKRVRYYSFALQIDPRNLHAWYQQGLALQRLGRLKEAAASFGKVLEMDEKHTGAWFALGQVQKDQKKFEEAVGTFDHLLGIDPGHSDALYSKGLALLSLKRPDSALETFDRLLGIESRACQCLVRQKHRPHRSRQAF